MGRIRRKVTRTGAKPRKKERKIVELTDEQKARQRAKDELLAQKLRNRVSHIIIPAGTPPFDLEGDDLEAIGDWLQRSREQVTTLFSLVNGGSNTSTIHSIRNNSG